MARSKQGSLLLGIGGGTLFIGGVLVAGYFVQVRDAAAKSREAAGEPAVKAEAKPDEAPAAKPSGDIAEIKAAVDKLLASDLELSFDKRTVSMSLADLGVAFDPSSAERASISGGKLDGFVPVIIDHEAGEKAVRALKVSYDRAPANARLDLEARKVHDAVDGWGLDLYGSISAIEAAARRGATKVELEGAVIPATVTTKELGISDISHVLATYTTKFAVSEKSRNANLKLLATRIDGLILQPGKVFSFNETTGDRTEREGYKMAHVIEAGEMVDGMAGGSCQISSTLHGASFFAGLDIVDSTPHSRPSTYVPMGLDATVVYPQTDLKLSNPYDFPVAIHYKVARGEATVEILGKKRPYDEVAFERDITKKIPFETITREDMGVAIGHMVVEQLGFHGYLLKRSRVFYKDGKEVKRDTWNVRYSPVVEYVRMGVNPDPNLPPPKDTKPHGPKPQGSTRIVQ